MVKEGRERFPKRAKSVALVLRYFRDESAWERSRVYKVEGSVGAGLARTIESE